MRAQSTLLLLAGLVAGLAASCYVTPATEGLPCEEDAACTDGQFCADGKCRYQCVSISDCDPGEICSASTSEQLACLPCSVDCGNGFCCGEGWICTDDGGCCPPGKPFYCGNEVCAPSADDCPGGGGPDDGGDGSDGTPGEDPEYPRPDPEGNCPPDMATLLGAPFCAPPCGANDFCPDGATGSADGQCVFNPDSSAVNCEETGECEIPEEECVENAGGGMSCLLPASHCVLFCDPDAQNCPVQMECIANGYCVYP